MDAPGNRSADGLSTPPPPSTSETLKIMSDDHPPEATLQAKPSEDEGRRQTVPAHENASHNITSAPEMTGSLQTSPGFWKGMKDILNKKGLEIFKQDQKDDFDKHFGALKEELEKALAAQTNGIQSSLNKHLENLKGQRKELEKALAAQTDGIQGSLNEHLEKALTAQTNAIQDFLKEHLESLKTHCVGKLTEVINGATIDLASKVQKDLVVGLMDEMKNGVVGAKKTEKVLKSPFLRQVVAANSFTHHFAGSCQSSLFGLVMMMAHSIAIGSVPRLLALTVAPNHQESNTQFSWDLSRNAMLECLIMLAAAAIVYLFVWGFKELGGGGLVDGRRQQSI